MFLRSVVVAAAGTALSAQAAPDEAALGKAQGYPVLRGASAPWGEHLMVGSFTHFSDIPGLFGGQANTLRPAVRPMRLPRSNREPAIAWTVRGKTLGVDDYLDRQRVTGTFRPWPGLRGLRAPLKTCCAWPRACGSTKRAKTSPAFAVPLRAKA